jgi:hypothetical protein
MSILSIVKAVVDLHSVLGAVAGSVATVSSQKVYAFVTKQTASVKAAAAAEISKAQSAASNVAADIAKKV